MSYTAASCPDEVPLPSLAQACEGVGINPIETQDAADTTLSSPVPLLSFMQKKNQAAAGSK
jgi:hypothetical protein